MNKRYSWIGVLTSFSLIVGAALAVTPDELQRAIDDRNNQLSEINSKIKETQSQITQLQGQGRTLKQALAALGYQVDQLNLGIKSSEVNIEKLGLELQSLGYELDEVGAEIDGKERAVAQVLREIQQNDREGLLEILLKNETLADGLLEVQNLRDLQNNLSFNIAQLTQLQGRLERTVVITSDKKSQLETENLNLKSRRSILAEQQIEKDRLLKETKNQESLYQQKLKVLEAEQRTILDEITRIEGELRSRFDPSSLPKKQAGILNWPVVLNGDGGRGRITQNFGETAYAGRFYKGQPHNGMDIGAPIGTPIYAASDGRVSRVDNNGRYQYGRYILIDHNNGLSSLYAHLSGVLVGTGQTVTRGQLIGYLGNTGFATGPHLHFGLYATPAGGWQIINSKSEAGLISLPPASGLVPIGITINPLNYL